MVNRKYMKFIEVKKGSEFNMDEEKNKNFFKQYEGAIIGVIVAILILATRLYTLVLWILFILAGGFIGNYIQNNKDEVKMKLKGYIDKM